ncbi:MAG: zf-HC2 domain-containing protein [Candidatus Baltobacteraceae bacterium]
MHDAHVGESAELYALGLLDLEERAELDRHIVQCAQCLRAVGEAEETVLFLERGSQLGASAKKRRLIAPVWLAIAAAFLLGLLPSIPLFVQNARDAQSIAIRNAATIAMIGSHFAHAQFTPVAAGAPSAKVIYARNGAWLYVIVAGSHRYQVETKDGRVLGVTEPRGAVSEFLLASPPKSSTLQLRSNGALIETARLGGP